MSYPKVINTITVGIEPNGISSDGTYVWVANNVADTVSQIDIAAASVINTISVGSYPFGISSDGTYVWVANKLNYSVSQIQIAPPPPTPPQPYVCEYPCPPAILAKPNIPFGGNTVNSSISNALRFSQIVRSPNNGRTVFINSTINAFGYYAGAPGGSGAPPSNRF